MNTSPITYTLKLFDPAAHIFEVACEVATPNPEGQCFYLPAWVPGSYMIREFAQHVIDATAFSNNEPVTLTKIDKATWRAAAVPAGQTLTLIWYVYAWDWSVRAAYLDEQVAFFNASSVFPVVVGFEHAPCTLHLPRPTSASQNAWQVATTLTACRQDLLDSQGFGLYAAPDYYTLLDNPVVIGTLSRAQFNVEGIPHEIVLYGHHDCDLSRLTKDLEKICRWQHQLLGTPADLKTYRFLVQATSNGYGGLEHQSCTVLFTPRKALPYPGMEGCPSDYQNFLGLCSHEYFHLWNVKRLKPANFAKLNLREENYTALLWFFEGFTSYYDDRALIQAGLINQTDYLTLLAKHINAVEQHAGQFKQSLQAASWDAWIKYYRPNENSPNATVSYYAKGALLALCLDLKLRQSPKNLTLDAWMHSLWQEYGQTGQGLSESALFASLSTYADPDTSQWLHTAISTPTALPLSELLGEIGFTLEYKPSHPQPSLGIRTKLEDGLHRITHVSDNSPGLAAGLSAGDLLVACNGLKLPAEGLPEALSRSKAGEQITLHAFRQDVLFSTQATLNPPELDKAHITPAARVSEAQQTRQNAWLAPKNP